MYRKTSIFFVLAVAASLISGCCKYISCECPQVGITIQYLIGGQTTCPADFRESVTYTDYDANGNIVNTGQLEAGSSCGVQVPYQPGLYRVITSLTYGISDTVRIENPTFADISSKCCPCDPIIDTAGISVNGEPYAQTNFVRRI